MDSIELATPELFADDINQEQPNQEKSDEKEFKMFEKQDNKEENTIKEPEMFEESTMEEDFEIPAFLRRQKN